MVECPSVSGVVVMRSYATLPAVCLFLVANMSIPARAITPGEVEVLRGRALEAVQRGDCRSAQDIADGSHNVFVAHEIRELCHKRSETNSTTGGATAVIATTSQVLTPVGQDTADDHQCRSYGAKRGSAAYVQCRLQVVQLRQEQARQAEQAAQNAAAQAAAQQAAAQQAAEARAEAAQQAAAAQQAQADAARRALLLQYLTRPQPTIQIPMLPIQPPSPALNCTTSYNGNQAYTHCQ